MTHRPDFTMAIEHAPTMRMCDICTTVIVSGDRFLATRIGEVPQSDICMSCGDSITDAINNLARPVAKTGRPTHARS